MDYPAGVSELSMSVLMTPDKANFSGNVHGGVLLKYLDEVAYACASRYAGRYVVTLSVDQVMFRQPVHVGELVTFMASVNYTGRTSMEIGIKVITEDIRQRSVRHTNSCFFTMVALDSSGKPTAVPPLELRPANNAAALPRPNSAGASAPNWSSATRRCAKASRTSEPQGSGDSARPSTTRRLRPSCLARYRARSARWKTSSAASSSGQSRPDRRTG